MPRLKEGKWEYLYEDNGRVLGLEMYCSFTININITIVMLCCVVS